MNSVLTSVAALGASIGVALSGLVPATMQRGYPADLSSTQVSAQVQRTAQVESSTQILADTQVPASAQTDMLPRVQVPEQNNTAGEHRAIQDANRKTTAPGWQVSESASIGSLRTGVLSLDASELRWMQVGAGDDGETDIGLDSLDLVSVHPTQGATLIGRASLTPGLIGHELAAILTVEWEGFSASGSTAAELVSIRTLIDDAESQTDLVLTENPREPLILSLLVEIAPGASAGEWADLGQLTVTLAQSGGGWAVPVVFDDFARISLAPLETDIPEVDIVYPPLDEIETVTPEIPPIAPPPTEPPPYPEIPEYCDPYRPTQNYFPGDCVSYNGSLWIADFENSTGVEPGTPWSAWMEVGQVITDAPADIVEMAPEGILVRSWTETWVYGRAETREVVEHNGRFFLLDTGREGARGMPTEPGLPNGPWLEIGQLISDIPAGLDIPDDATVRAWTESWIYGRDGVFEFVEYQSQFFQVLTWNRGVAPVPSTPGNPWQLVSGQPLDAGTLPTPVPGDMPDSSPVTQTPDTHPDMPNPDATSPENSAPDPGNPDTSAPATPDQPQPEPPNPDGPPPDLPVVEPPPSGPSVGNDVGASVDLPHHAS